MGKMGDAASLGAVAIAGIVLLKILGMPKLELPKLPGFEWPFTAPDPYLPRAGDIYDIPAILDDTLMVDVDPYIPAVPDPRFYDVSRTAAGIAADAARLAHWKDVSAQADIDLARFQTYLDVARANGNADVDAGGSTDMDPSPAPVWGSRRVTTR